MGDVKKNVEKFIENIFQNDNVFYNVDPTSSPFDKLAAILANSQGSTVGRKNYKKLLRTMNDIGIECSDKIKKQRPLGFSLEGMGMIISVLVHLLFFALLMILLFFGLNVPMLYASQVFVSKDVVGGLLAKHINPITTAISPSSLQSVVVRGEMDRYYEALHNNSDKLFEKNNRQCVMNAIYMIAIIVVALIVCYFISEYYLHNKIEWFRLIVYIITILVLFAVFEAALFVTIIMKYNPMPQVEEQQTFIRSLVKKIQVPLEELYSSHDEFEKDSQIYRTPIIEDIIKPILSAKLNSSKNQQ